MERDSNDAAFISVLVFHVCLFYSQYPSGLQGSEPHFHSFNSLGSHHRTGMNLDAFGMPVFKKRFHPSMNPVDGPYYTFYNGLCLYTR